VIAVKEEEEDCPATGPQGARLTGLGGGLVVANSSLSIFVSNLCKIAD